ncbi:MAG: RagB/SusD family nutrient uptake outer membrane protein [Chitinophagaceae bacterium]|nr:MAG: RagB/SusD family nutrient uptake outer membrane protein [Chitinophagaceae bacterium]
MKLRYLYVLVFVAIVSIAFTGCQKDLNQLPQTTLTNANFWKTPNDLELACNYLYAYLPGLGGPASIEPAEDLMSNTAFGILGINQVSDGSRLAPATDGNWNRDYDLIRACNNIFEHAASVTGDTATINQYLGEAHFFRAWGYFDLVKRFGDVPLIMKTLTLSDSLLYSSRINRETVLDSVYADLNYAAAHCPLPSALPASEYGRITSTAALAFESRVALFEGTWDKFHDEGNYQKHLQICINACNTIMSSGECSLFKYAPDPDSSYYYLFQYQNDASETNYTYATNHGIILARLYGQNLSNNIASHSFERGWATDGDIFGTRNLVDLYLYKDGLPGGKSLYDSSKDETSSLTVFRNRDPRFGMTFTKEGDIIGSITGDIPYTPRFQYNIKKYNVVSEFTQQTSFLNYMIIRYGEVLLNYAEATYELNNSISDQDLNKSINLIRVRVNMPPLTNEFVQANELDMRTEIRRERTIELSFEGFHYWDLLRWKTAETVLPQALLGSKYFPADMPNAPAAQFNSDGFSIWQPASKRSFNPQRDYLWPLPTRELGLNKKLTQNPGW